MTFAKHYCEAEALDNSPPNRGTAAQASDEETRRCIDPAELAITANAIVTHPAEAPKSPWAQANGEHTAGAQMPSLPGMANAEWARRYVSEGSQFGVP